MRLRTDPSVDPTLKEGFGRNMELKVEELFDDVLNTVIRSLASLSFALTGSPRRISLWTSSLPALGDCHVKKGMGVRSSDLLILFHIENDAGHMTHCSRSNGEIAHQLFFLLLDFFLRSIEFIIVIHERVSTHRR